MGQSRVLIAWEIGENFGHVLPLLSIAHRLRDAGCSVVFALRDLRRAAPVRSAGFDVLQAPCHPDRWFGPGETQPANLAEILALFGFADATTLDTYVAAWRNLYTLTRPDLVITSYAPTAILAARLDGIAAAILALPFELPPRGVPLPGLRPWENLPADRHARAEAAVVNTVNRVADKRLHIDALHELFEVERVYLNTFSELDAYSVRPKGDGDYGGALFEPDTGIPAEWPSGAGQKVFAYLQPGMPGFAAMLKQLDASPLRTLVAAPGLPRQTVRSKGNLCIVNQMVSFKSAFAQCDAVLTYGGHGMVAGALLAGKPLALVPRNLEQLLTARGVVRLGAGVIAPETENGDIAAVLESLLVNPEYGKAARTFARKYAGYDPRVRADEIAEDLLGLVSGVLVEREMVRDEARWRHVE